LKNWLALHGSPYKDCIGGQPTVGISIAQSLWTNSGHRGPRYKHNAIRERRDPVVSGGEDGATLAERYQRPMGRDPVAAIPFLQHGPDPRPACSFRDLRCEGPIAIERYRRLSEEAFAILDARLAKAQFLAGDEYSIADIATFAWVHVAGLCDFAMDPYKSLALWCARLRARPAVQKGIAIPELATGP